MLSRATSEIAISVGQHSIAGRKRRNDDSYGVLLPEKALLATKGVAIAIADGMSSSEAAKEASETCVRSFLDDYFATPPSWTVKTSVERVLSAANRWMQSQSEALSAEGRGMGRPGQPAELAPLYVLLASSEPTYTTGQVFGAVGGRGGP